MRAASVLAVLSLGVMVVLIWQAVQQELNLRQHKSSLAQTTANIRRKEEIIAQINLKIREVNNELTPLNEKKQDLLKKVQEADTAIAEFGKTLDACNAEKVEVDQKVGVLYEALQKLKDNQEAEKQKAQEEIQGLKQSILDRDKAVCAFVDLNNEEAKKLCGNPETPV